MSYQCELKEQAIQPTLTIRATVSVQGLSQVLGQAYGAIAQFPAQVECCHWTTVGLRSGLTVVW